MVETDFGRPKWIARHLHLHRRTMDIAYRLSHRTLMALYVIEFF